MVHPDEAMGGFEIVLAATDVQAGCAGIIPKATTPSTVSKGSPIPRVIRT
jgi:hypothetical protein